MSKTAPLPEEIKTEVIENICNLYAKGLYPLAECCTMHGLSDRTFRRWREVSDFANKSYLEACAKRLIALRTEMVQKASNAIVVALEGAETTETTIVSTVEYDKNGKIVLDENNLPKKKVKEIRTKTTKAQPCATTARFVLQKLQRKDFGDNDAAGGNQNQQIDLEEREEILQAALLEAQAQRNHTEQKNE
jgi:hypothetical protein